MARREGDAGLRGAGIQNRDREGAAGAGQRGLREEKTPATAGRLRHGDEGRQAGTAEESDHGSHR